MHLNNLKIRIEAAGIVKKSKLHFRKRKELKTFNAKCFISKTCIIINSCRPKSKSETL